MDGRVTQLCLGASAPVDIQIDKIQVEPYQHGWEFNNQQDPDGWSAWNDILPMEMGDGTVYSTATGEDPYMGSSPLDIPAAEYTRIEIRMRTTNGSDGQIFFITDQDPNWFGTKSQFFSINSDGGFHVYQIDMSNVRGWDGRILQVRLDPMNIAGDFEIDYIRIIQP